MLKVALDRPVFVVGAARSGTTVLTRMLSRHPDLALHGETHFLTKWLERFPGLLADDASVVPRFLDAWLDSVHHERTGVSAALVRSEVLAASPPLARNILATILELFRHDQGVARTGEKTPSHFREVARLLSWYPDARIVWMLRDPRAVAASRLQLAASWGDDDPFAASTQWNAAWSMFTRWQSDPRVLAQRYEDLVMQPDTAVPAMLAFLELDPDRILDEATQSGAVHGSFDPDGPLRPDSVERWRTTLSAREVQVIELNTRANLIAAGYEPSTTPGLAARTELARLRAARSVGRRLGSRRKR